MKTDGDLRMLGAMDGFAHALVWVNEHIGRINGPYSPSSLVIASAFIANDPGARKNGLPVASVLAGLRWRTSNLGARGSCCIRSADLPALWGLPRNS